jgi:hypothetical protein
MARPLEWTYQLKEALTLLQQIDVPVITSAGLAAALRLSRRQATTIMQQLGAPVEARRRILDRRVMIERLERIAQGETFDQQTVRQKRLVRLIFDARKHLRSREQVLHPQPVKGLPATVKVRRGQPHRLEIEYTDALGLLTTLMEIGTAASEDFDGLRRQVE